MNILPANSINLKAALDVLRSGGVVAHATETCYGLACDITNPEAVARLFAIKQRPTTQPVSALFSSIEEAKKYVEWNERAEELATKHLPGPLTLILPLRQVSPFSLLPFPATENSKPKTIGVRISSHPLATQLVTEFGRPITTTSANLHGQRNPYDPQSIIVQLEQHSPQPDLILDSGELPETPPSTVMDLTTENPQALRQGQITA